MKTTSAPLKLTLAALLMSPVPAATAALLGDVVSLSAIGEPLRVEIASRGATPDQIATCLRVSRSVTAPDGLPTVSNARIGTSGRGSDMRVLITQAAPMAEPAVRLVLEDVCETRLRREYVLLLPYPTALPAPAPSLEAATEPAGLPGTAGPTRAPAPRKASGRTWVTAPGETPESLAVALYPHDEALRQRFVTALMKANPGILGTGASPGDALPPGTELVIPAPPRVAAATASKRAASTATPPAPRPPVAEASPDSPRRADARKPDATPADRLRLDGTDEPAAAASAGGRRTDAPLTGAEAERVREERLVAAVDRSINMQLELMERIRRLEEIQAALKEELDKTRAALPAPGAAPTASAPVRPAEAPAEPASPRGVPDWIYTLAALVTLAAALAGVLIVLSRRRAEAVPQSPKAPTAPREAWPGTAVIEDEARDARFAEHGEPATQVPDFSPLEWDPAPRGLQAATLPPVILEEETVEEHDSAIELAEIMLGFGRVQGAAETLAEFIQANPKQAVTPWLKLLEVYRAAGLRAEFDGLARQLNKTFNVKAVTWDTFDEARATTSTVEQMPHVVESLQKLWGTRDCQAYLQRLLRDNRDGTRQGFPLAVIDEILMLSAVLEQELGPYRPAPAPPPNEDEPQRQAA